jgi:hypothetical protein
VTQEPKLCKDCKHFEAVSADNMCFHPNFVSVDLINGWQRGVLAYPMRKHGSACKPQALLFESKPLIKPTLTQKIKGLFVKEGE